MAKKGGVLQALRNLIRWTLWALAAVLLVAVWLKWSDQDTGTEGGVVAEGPGASVEEVGELDVKPEEPAAEPEAAETPAESIETAVEEVATEAEAAVTEATEKAEAAVAEAAEKAEAAVDEAKDAVAGAVEKATAAIEKQAADLNIVPPELAEIRVPGDDATYALISVFERDDGAIEVVSARTAGGETLQTTRLVTCAPLAVGVIAEGEGPRNETPELERIPLGSADATIAALACGAMN